MLLLRADAFLGFLSTLPSPIILSTAPITLNFCRITYAILEEICEEFYDFNLDIVIILGCSSKSDTFA